MKTFFQGLLNEDIITEAIPIFGNMDRADVRCIRSNLRRNNELRKSVNERKTSIKTLVSLPKEELADDHIKDIRYQEKIHNMKSALSDKKLELSKYEIDILKNKIEDP